ncbi:DUF6240 domain-containing protein [Tepidimicrobium xylanilyticum]|uniref:Flagellar hook-length control protein FliK n=1 Tax=Tepidimicrobium xylanilyticum TaxID=1123352 RepID=A0A1H3C912_9FIRM|nr:DUF6240 domain-containing protein [Tepidimicrobium xylanilyticum]GMG97989.1 hypothetical protein EN5CB1_28150 [Tepidimicrobium xylanilyticum]SDX50576.1 hypothetical protein SAMN05660923_02421 [Tepidimicrobium xylanilyticum]
MEAINFSTKKNIVDAYGLAPTLFYDVEGTLVEKKGKDITIEKVFEDKKVLYSLRVREEVNQVLGEKVLINKENILSMKVEEVEEEKENSIGYKEVMDNMGIEDSEENIRAIEHLLENNIPITKENILAYNTSKKYLEEIIKNLDFESCIKLMEKGIDLKGDSLQKIAEALLEIKEDKGLSFKELIKLDRKLSYKEAESIAKKIYGRRMGKDVYDSIIALHKEGIPINKENIERVMEVIDKLYDLKDYKEETLVRFFKEDLPFNIDNLYKYKHSYNNKSLERNILSPVYEVYTIEKEEIYNYILEILKKLNLDAKSENIQMIREFLLNGIEVTEGNIQKLMDMKAALNELVNKLDSNKVAFLMEEGIDPLKEDIFLLVEKLKEKDGNDNDLSEKSSDILKEIESLKAISDKELLKLIKSGKDFKIENLKELITTDIPPEDLNGKVIEKVKTLSNIFNTLEDLNSNTIALTYRRFNAITLNNLYLSHLEVAAKEEVVVEPIAKVEENLIRQEYLNAKNNTTLSLIKQSIKEGIALEHMPLEELNQYIDRKINRYREAQRLINEIKYLKGREESLISTVLKNDLNMSIDKLNNINSLLYRAKGLGSIFNEVLNNKDSYSKDLQEKIEILETKIKEFSSSLKNGKHEIKEEYKETLNAIKDLSSSFNSNGSNERNKEDRLMQLDEFLSLQSHLSKDDLVFQLPIFIDGTYNNINLIIPNVKKGINKNDMVFYFNMDLNNLGQTRFNIQIKGKKMYVDFNSDKDEAIRENANLLKEGLERIGYTLEELKANEELR